MKLVLKALDFNKPFSLATDASDYGIRAVLLQEDDDGKLHPVGYHLKFYAHQKNYSMIEKEVLALIDSLKHFEIYVSTSASPTIMFIDHNTLVFIHKIKNTNRRLLSWRLLAQEFNLEIRHIAGRQHHSKYIVTNVKRSLSRIKDQARETNSEGLS